LRFQSEEYEPLDEDEDEEEDEEEDDDELAVLFYQ